MKKLLFALPVVATALIAAPRPASAQTDAALVKVPFQFIVGDRVLPAGSYRIAPDPQDASVLVITNVSGRPAAVFSAIARAQDRSANAPVKAAFKNVDGHYFLWQVAMPGSDIREVAFTRAEAERTLAKLNLMPAEHADVAR